MKILIATGLYPPQSGGPATYTKLLEERLPALGFVVSVLPFSRVWHLPKLLRHAAYFFACVRMGRKTETIYAQDTVSVGLPAALAATLLRKKFLVRVPGDYAWEQARGRFGVTDELDVFQSKKYGWRIEILRAVQRFVVRRARGVVVPSEYMKKIVSGWLVPGGVQPTVIYSGVELPVPAEMPFDFAQGKPQGFLVVTVARNVPWKGLEGLTRVVARERQWHLKIIDGLPRAQALGWVKAADVFVLNSTYEGLSHALIEAMSLGTPIVATAVGGNPELIVHGVEGLLIPAKDDDALYAALRKVEQEPNTARARAEAARKKSGEFSIDRTLLKLREFLHS